MTVLYKHSVFIYKRFVLRNYNFLLQARCNSLLTDKKPIIKNEQMDYLKTEIQKNINMEWGELKENVLSKQGILNQKNIDAVILKAIVSAKKFDAGISFANYLKTSNPELSLGAINSILNLYYEYGKENVLSDEEKQFILNAYQHLYDSYKVLDYSTSEKLLHALSTINEWKKCIRVLNDIHLSGVPSHSAFSTVVAVLFKNNKKAEALNLMSKSILNNRPLQDIAYAEWIKYIFRKYKDKKVLLKHLNEICIHICDNCSVVPVQTAERLKESFEQLNWKGEFASIKKQSAFCMACHEQLQCLTLSEEEFIILQKNVKDKLIIGSDLLQKSSTEELQRFLDFVKATAPYDVVLDALNIAFTVGEGHNRIRVLNYVVDYFNKRNKRILLLGRKHMLRWQRGALMKLLKNTESFFIDDISQDDPYFITAAILSGSHTDLVSRDLLRGHRFLMQHNNLQRLFQRWQWQHQWMVFVPNYKVVIQPPLRFTPLAQQSSSGWHLPYIAENVSQSGQVNDGVHDCSSWLCLQSNNPGKIK